SPNMSSAIVRISAGLAAGDVLSFTNQNGITGTYNSATGVLTLSGVSSKANYEAALRSITYSSTSENPTGSRTVSFSVSDGTEFSAAASSTVNITSVNDAPVVAGATTTAAFTEGGSAVTVNPYVHVADVDSTTLASAT